MLKARWWFMKSEWIYDIIAPIYDEDMGLNMPFDDVAGYLKLLPSAPAKLLEIGCGTGRLTLALAACGFEITAIDRSAPMLEQLQNKLSPKHDIRPIHMDARNVRLAGPFDAVFFGYSGFQYLLNDPDIGLFCERVKQILTPDGSLSLDIFLHQERSETASFVLDYERELEDGRVLRRCKCVSVNHGINTIRRKYAVTGTGEQLRYQTESRQRLYTVDSLETTLKKHGFKLDTGIYDYQSQTC
ncbi:MAG: class I SAM-dependent methyltransferase, partial [Desulfuromusa sp.]|nr:class I SAM-dependent methyltransferase [Desulfuromusa sp.]